MKGGLACALTALRLLEEQGIRLAGDVILESVVDEETGGPGTRACDVGRVPARRRGRDEGRRDARDDPVSHFSPASFARLTDSTAFRATSGPSTECASAATMKRFATTAVVWPCFAPFSHSSKPG